MREILFKAKRLDNGEWVEGNIVAVPEDADFMPGAYILPRLVSARADEDGLCNDWTLEDEAKPENWPNLIHCGSIHGGEAGQ